MLFRSTIPFQVLAIFILAVMSYYLVERPLRFSRWHSSRLVEALLGSLAILVTGCFVVLLGAPLQGKFFLGRGGFRAAQDQFASSLVDQQDPSIQSVKSQLSQCNVTPFLLGSGSYQLSRPVDAAFLRECLQPAAAYDHAGPRILLIGDSFAEKLAPQAALIAKKLGYEIGRAHV